MVTSKINDTTKNLFKVITVYNRLILGFLLCTAVVMVFYLNYQGMISPKYIFLYLQEHKRIAPIIFISLYIVLVLCMLPTLPLNLGAGLIWGTWWGMLYSIIGASLGALIAFIISRYLIRDFFNDKFNHSAWIWIQEEAAQKSWKLVAFTRINPIFPFGPTNYFFGVTRISLKNYLFGTILFIIPPSLIVATFGASINDFMANAQAEIYLQKLLLIGFGVTLLIMLKMVFSRKPDKTSE